MAKLPTPATPSNDWATLLYYVSHGRRIEPQELIDLLRSGEPVPDDAREFLADVIEGKHKFKFTQGIKPRKRKAEWGPIMFPEILLGLVEDRIANNEIKLKQGESAKSIAAELLNISVRVLNRRLKENI